MDGTIFPKQAVTQYMVEWIQRKLPEAGRGRYLIILYEENKYTPEINLIFPEE
jgi:hypothetical protein